jgi:hypothetical protein
MAEPQRKFSFFIMVKIPGGPAIRVVALLAFLTKRTLMLIYISMAITTGGWCVFVRHRNVTLLTWCNCMESNKGELRYIVIKMNLLIPTCLGMTGITLLS